MLGSYNLSWLLFLGDNYVLDMAHLHLDHCIASMGNPFHKREHNKDSVSKSKNLCNVLKEPKPEVL
jgi:hypothetical protein